MYRIYIVGGRNVWWVVERNSTVNILWFLRIRPEHDFMREFWNRHEEHMFLDWHFLCDSHWRTCSSLLGTMYRFRYYVQNCRFSSLRKLCTEFTKSGSAPRVVSFMYQLMSVSLVAVSRAPWRVISTLECQAASVLVVYIVRSDLYIVSQICT